MDQDNQPQTTPASEPSNAPTSQSQTQQAQPTGENPGQLFGILSIVMIFVFQPLGIVFGFLSRKRSKEAGMPSGLGTAGLVINSILVALGIIIAIIVVVILAAAGSSGNLDVETSTGTGGSSYDSSLSE